jgi:hypothetical protein
MVEKRMLIFGGRGWLFHLPMIAYYCSCWLTLIIGWILALPEVMIVVFGGHEWWAFGGLAGGGGPIMGDLWALKGLFDEGKSLLCWLWSMSPPCKVKIALSFGVSWLIFTCLILTLCTFVSHIWGGLLSYLWKEEQEPPAWTQLKLPGSGPAPRCGHSTTAGGSQVCTFLPTSRNVYGYMHCFWKLLCGLEPLPSRWFLNFCLIPVANPDLFSGFLYCSC